MRHILERTTASSAAFHLRHVSDGCAKNCGRLSQTLHEGPACGPETNHVDYTSNRKPAARVEKLDLTTHISQRNRSTKQGSANTDHRCLFPCVSESLVRLEEERAPAKQCAIRMQMTCKTGSRWIASSCFCGTLQTSRKHRCTVGEAVCATGSRKGTESRPLVAGAVDGR